MNLLKILFNPKFLGDIVIQIPYGLYKLGQKKYAS